MKNRKWFKKFKDTALGFLCSCVWVFVCFWIVGFFMYPSFSWTLLFIIILTVPVCLVGNLDVDYGLAIMPYMGISSVFYVVSFVALQSLKFSGFVNFEIGWKVLGIVAVVSLLVTFITCWLINKPKEEL